MSTFRLEKNNLVLTDIVPSMPQLLIEERLQQLDLIVSKQGNKESRRGGQWNGKVKIAEDFDELPESFMEFFRGENE